MPFPYTFPAQLSQRKIIVNIAFYQPGTVWAPWYRYVDVSDYVEAIYIRRGRQHELDRFEAGTCRILLNNQDRRFDPFNTANPYGSQNIVPMRRVRVSMAWGPRLYHIFTGFIEAWPQSWPEFGRGVIELEAVDGFKLLNLARVTGSFPQELSSDRVHRVLDAAGWPAEDRLILQGQSVVQAATLNNVQALAHLQEVQQTEMGRLFCDGLGRVFFQDRHYSLRPERLQSVAVFGDRPHELPYEELKIRYDDSQIWNDVTVQRQNGAPQQATDSTSIYQFARRSLVRDRTLHTSDHETYDAACWLLSRYKDPVLRVERITIDVFSDTRLPDAVLPREIGDRITVIRRPPGPGTGVIQRDYFIEGIEWDITRERTRVSWQLSLADNWVYWVLGDPYLSVLGSTTRLGY